MHFCDVILADEIEKVPLRAELVNLTVRPYLALDWQDKILPPSKWKHNRIFAVSSINLVFLISYTHYSNGVRDCYYAED